MERVQINEVGPRDGLQNEKQIIPTQTKIKFINALSEAGLTYIEATSFVAKDWVPQLADHKEVYAAITKAPGVRYPVLVPNVSGMQAAIDSGVTDIAVFTAASEKFTQKNTNCSIDESLQRIRDIVSMANEHAIPVRGYISCVIACPYAGKTAPNQVVDLTQQLRDLGCYEVSLGDTIGVATPRDVERLLQLVLDDCDPALIAMHFHDTNKRALDNIKLSLDAAIRSFDASLGGLGGCPYAGGATGNVATEQVVDLLHELGYDTGVDVAKLSIALSVIIDKE